MQITEYIILSDEGTGGLGHTGLANQVNNYISQGWIPQGGVHVHFVWDDNLFLLNEIFTQAMVKKK